VGRNQTCQLPSSFVKTARFPLVVAATAKARDGRGT
jgi:hypothetical protein